MSNSRELSKVFTASTALVTDVDMVTMVTAIKTARLEFDRGVS